MRYPLMRNNILREDLQSVITLLNETDPQLTAGPKVREFEQAWSKWLGCRYSVFVNSGASANLLSIAWLKEKFPEGGQVIVPPFTWSSDISSVIWMGFKPLFVDIRLDTLGIDGKLLREVLDQYDDVRAVFLTHAQGFNGLCPETLELCQTRNIVLIEDVCESHGVVLADGRKAGTAGELSCFSFYYAHHMSTIEGGMICTNNEEIYETMRMLRSHGMLREATSLDIRASWENKHPDLNPKFIFTRPAFNVRNTEIGALIGLSQLKRLDDMIVKRRANFEYFLENLPCWAYADFKLEGQSNYAFNLILKDPDEPLMQRLMKRFDSEGIEFRRGSAGGGNQLRQPYVKALGLKSSINPSESVPIADHVHFYGMYIGNYPELPRQEIDWLNSVIRSV